MTAPVRPRTAADRFEIWQQATHLRAEWLRIGMSAEPADRATAEHSVAGIYARVNRSRPRFEWVDSPYKALPLVAGLPHLELLYERIHALRRPAGPAPLASDIAASLSRLRGALTDGLLFPDPEPTGNRKKVPKPDALPPLDALRAGTSLRRVLQHGVAEALYVSLARGFFLPVKAALGPPSVPVCWYGQQDAFWIAYYDALRRLGLAKYTSDDTEQLDGWAALARSTGWWWPGEDVCVMVERPATVHTARIPDSWCDEVRATRIGYRDGWQPRLS
jgi:hypothetical protein